MQCAVKEVQGSPCVPRLQAALPGEGGLTFRSISACRPGMFAMTNLQFIRKILP